MEEAKRMMSNDESLLKLWVGTEEIMELVEEREWKERVIGWKERAKEELEMMGKLLEEVNGYVGRRKGRSLGGEGAGGEWVGEGVEICKVIVDAELGKEGTEIEDAVIFLDKISRGGIHFGHEWGNVVEHAKGKVVENATIILKKELEELGEGDKWKEEGEGESRRRWETWSWSGGAGGWI